MNREAAPPLSHSQGDRTSHNRTSNRKKKKKKINPLESASLVKYPVLSVSHEVLHDISEERLGY